MTASTNGKNRKLEEDQIPSASVEAAVRWRLPGSHLELGAIFGDHHLAGEAAADLT